VPGCKLDDRGSISGVCKELCLVTASRLAVGYA
jgi:hypothetical protein